MLQRDSHQKALLNNTATIMVASLLSVLMQSGCSRMAINDGSMDYQKAYRIDAVQVPSNLQTRQIAPLYPVPIIPDNTESIQLILTNTKGNRYQLPKPKPINLNQAADRQTNSVLSKPELVIDGNGFPVLKIGGDPAKVLEILDRSLSVANVNVTKRNTHQLTISHDNLAHEIRLGRIGDTTTLTVLQPDESFANKENATDLLELIVRNWSTS